MADLTITHTHADGTRLTGSTKGDGVLEIARANGFTWRRYAGIHIRGSRDRLARRDTINTAADALRAAGHTVTINIDDTPRPAEVRETELAERAERRADRYADRANKATANSEAAHAKVRRITDHIPFGQPILVGHHSQRRAERDEERIVSGMRKVVEEAKRAVELGRRSHEARVTVAHRNNPTVIMRRVERLDTAARDVARKLDDATAGSEWHAWLDARATQLAEDVAYWRGELDRLRESGEFIPWGPEHCRKGDAVRVLGRWYEVRRVNRKSVSVPNHMGGSWNDTVTWDKVTGRRRDGMQWETPNGEPWPVDLARKVARWEAMQGRAKYQVTAGRAQRIAHGLHAGATDAEVTAFAPDPDDVDTCRALTAAYITIFDRLESGETADDIRAGLPEVPEVVPAWRMPAGEPEQIQVGDVRAGDIIAGRYDRNFGAGLTLRGGFAGPVVEVIPHAGDEYSGERFVGWWRVVLTTGETREFKRWDWLAVHRAPVAELAAQTDTEPAEVIVYAGADTRCGVLCESPADDLDTVAVRFDGDSHPQRFSRHIVAPFADAADAWHVVDAAGVVVAGGPNLSRERAQEIAAEGHEWFTGPASVVRGVPGVTCGPVQPPPPVDPWADLLAARNAA